MYIFLRKFHRKFDNSQKKDLFVLISQFARGYFSKKKSLSTWTICERIFYKRSCLYFDIL